MADNRPYLEWTTDDVCQFLCDKGFGDDIQQNFRENEIDGSILDDLNDRMIKDLVGNNIKLQVKLMQTLAEKRKDAACEDTSRYPTHAQYTEVCSKLVAAYPFLRDRSATGYELIHDSLKNKFKKERAPLVQEQEVKTKKAKFGTKGAGPVVQTTSKIVKVERKEADLENCEVELEDEETTRRHLKKLKEEMRKMDPNMAVLKDHWKRTFRHRREYTQEKDTKSTTEEYPAIVKNEILHYELELMYSVNLIEELDVSLKRHAEKLMEAAASKVKTKYIFTQLNLKTDTCLKEEISEFRSMAAIYIVPYLFNEKPEFIYTDSIHQALPPTPVITIKDDIPLKTSEEQCLLRTKEVHHYHLNAIQQNPANCVIYGVHGESALTAIHAFNVTDCLPPDLMHDCLEGVFVQTIQVVLAALIHDGEFTLAHLNSSICDFEYGENDSKNRPSSISNPTKGIAGSASQKWCLFRLLPQIIGRNVPLGNDHWQLYLLLREIADVLFAPVIRKSWILPLSNLIAEFIELFKDYVESVSCKVHYLVHYPRLTMLFGPLIHLWCMRFEAKHQYFKQLARVMRNFMNVSSTLATRHQLKQCWEQITKSPLGSLSVQGGSEVNLHSLPADLQRMLTRKVRSMDITFSVNDILWKYTGIVKDNVTFSLNDCFIVELLHGEEIPLFVEIKYIISTRGIYLLCGCVVIPEQFVSHMHAYQVKKTGDWLVFEPGEQLNHHALDIYKDLEVYYIPLRYRVTGTGVT